MAMSEPVSAILDVDLEPESITAIPVRHYWRWVGSAASLFVAFLVIRLFVLSPNITWSSVRHYILARQILLGLELTIIYTFLAMALGAGLGVLLAVMRMSVNPVLRMLSWVYIWLFRGTPLLLQILVLYNVALILPRVGIGLPYTHIWASTTTNTVMTTAVAAVLALGLNEGAYMSEIVRAGIQVIDYGQTEAGLALGMKRSQVFRKIVLPQAMRAIIPPTGNELIGMLKNTSLVSVIAASELLTRVQIIYAMNFKLIELLIVAAFWYLLITTILTCGQFYVERHFARGANSRQLPPTPIQRLRKRIGWAAPRIPRTGGGE